MKPEIGFYILCRIWNHILYDEDAYAAGALPLIADLKSKCIQESDDLEAINFIIDCDSWALNTFSEPAQEEIAA